MRISIKSTCQKLVYCLLIVLCFQNISNELEATTSSRVYHNINDIEFEKKIDQLLLLIQKRLVIMHEVARTKLY